MYYIIYIYTKRKKTLHLQILNINWGNVKEFFKVNFYYLF